jgi:hypothetical protein
MSGAQPENPNPPSEAAPGAAIEIDLYCLHCGYNLRGLSGDPVRCPECGNWNPIGDVEIPAPIIKKQLQRMETAPTVSVLGLLLMVPVLTASAIVLRAGDTEAAVRLLIAALAGATVWLFGILRFRSSCLDRPGWLVALVRYQIVALILVALMLAPFWFVPAMTIPHGWPLSRHDWACVAFTLLFAAVIAGIVWGLRPIHRCVKGPMERLQREVAVKIARDRVRRELHRQRRWGKGI